jgi:hypothetical protein
MTARLSPAASEAFTSRFLARMRPELAASFTPEQLAAVRMAFGMRYAMDHAVDMRRTLALPWGRFYLVLLCGRDQRCEGRPVGMAGWLMRIAAGAMLLLGLLLTI